MLYFENECEAPRISGFIPNSQYRLEWFDPITGEWLPQPAQQTTSGGGSLVIDSFPDNTTISIRDWSLKIILSE